VVTAVAVIVLRDLVAAVMVFGIYSLVSAALFVVLDAPDVAFTEAAVGAGITTMLMLAAVSGVEREERRPARRPYLPLTVVLITGGFLIYGTLDIPPLGAADNPAQQHVARYYIEHTEAQIGIPNMVTAVLASYRGVDTLGEVVVVFTGTIAVLALLGDGRRPRAGTRVEPQDDGGRPDEENA